MGDMQSTTAHGKRTTATDVAISRTISGILALTGTPERAFWETVGISRTTFYERMRAEKPWTASEVQAAADFLGVSVGDLYTRHIPDDLPLWGGSPVTRGEPATSPQLTLWGDAPDPIPLPRRAFTDSYDYALGRAS